jgi:hypothetical protein
MISRAVKRARHTLRATVDGSEGSRTNVKVGELVVLDIDFVAGPRSLGLLLDFLGLYLISMRMKNWS